MNSPFIRSEFLLGSQGMNKFANSTVAVFGVGGVGSYAVEALVRTGLGSIVFIDYDTIDISKLVY